MPAHYDVDVFQGATREFIRRECGYFTSLWSRELAATRSVGAVLTAPVLPLFLSEGS